MTDTDEGKAALEAAALETAERQGAMFTDNPESFTDDARAIVRAYLQALPGWRMGPVELTPEMMAAGCEHVGSTQTIETLWWAIQRNFPPPPGLEPDSHE